MDNAYLILEDGTKFCGKSIGSRREVISEVVFNTSMTGYLEVLTDPSYAGQALVMTYPLIGNYGISIEDMESSRAWPDAFIVRELSRIRHCISGSFCSIRSPDQTSAGASSAYNSPSQNLQW